MWSTKARQGNPLHRICAYQGCFPPQLPSYFLDLYPEAGVVLDPFCGRGTTILEAALRGKRVLGADTFAVSRLLSSVKIRCAPRAEVLREIEAMDISGSAPEPPPDVEPFYHPNTWRQLWNLREQGPSQEVYALAMGRLHGHSPGFFSCTTFNVVSMHGSSLRKMCAKHGTSPESRDVKELLKKAATRFLPEEALDSEGEIYDADARDLPIETGSVDLVVTSPPFFDNIDYDDVNWLRAWFLDMPSRPGTLCHGRVEYVDFLCDVFRELARVVRSGGHIVFEVGPLKRKESATALVLEAASSLLKLESVIVNDFSEKGVPKISRAMVGKKTTTMENHCVVFRAP